jgi:ABC-2 type transport system permease protein
MLCYKAWRESRLGFLLSVAALVFFLGVYTMFPRIDPLHRYTYTQETYLITYRGAVRNMFIVLTLLLGMGGLLRERSHHAVGFTLALPVSRFKLVATRAGVGVAEMAVLALVPALLLPVFTGLSHHTYPSFAQALQFSAVWIGCGTIFFAAGFFLSSVVSGDYPTAAACLICLFAYLMVLNLDFFERFPSLDLFNVMSGERMPYFSGRDTCALTYLPWRTLLIIALLACVVLSAARQIIERLDF